MCTGKCSLCIAYTLYLLVFLSMLCNIILFFPGGSVKYSREDHITEEVKYLGGLIGGGLMVLIPALYISFTGEEGCCGNRCGMFFSIGFAVEGLAGALYSFVVASSGVGNGPLCLYNGQWTTPFKNSNVSYQDPEVWTRCIEPENVLQFNTGLFCTLMAVSCVQAILCVIQMINGLIGCLCGTCNKTETWTMN